MRNVLSANLLRLRKSRGCDHVPDENRGHDARKLLAGSRLFDRSDIALCDALYRRPSATDGTVVIIGIDQKAPGAYGPYQEWRRHGIAKTLDILNADQNSRRQSASMCSLAGRRIKRRI